MKFELKEILAIAIAVVAAAGAFAVAQYRIDSLNSKVEKLEDQPIRLSILENEVKRTRCDVGNIKRLIKSQPETDC